MISSFLSSKSYTKTEEVNGLSLTFEAELKFKNNNKYNLMHFHHMC